MKKPNLAIVGASGLVGRTFLKVLEERDFPFENIFVTRRKTIFYLLSDFLGQHRTNSV